MSKKLTIPSFSISLPGTSEILVVLLLIASFFLGSFTTKAHLLDKIYGSGSPAVQAQVVPAAPEQQQQEQPSSIEGKIVNVDAGQLPFKGNSAAKVTIVEFADFRCPFCEKFFTDVEQQLTKEYIDTGKVKLSYRHYAFLGDASIVAANASECANEQSKFWEMHDYLYKNQPSESDTTLYTTDKLTEAATSLGLSSTNFRSCLESKKYDQKVKDDLAAGQKAGVQGTPTVFVNGTAIVGAQPYSSFKSAIDKALEGI
ncbi:MAG: hypothetical protein A2W22_05150 [Candidatus Levybacteria bacterium RBG_16_35_11]|nr:MAG: hypothetical protein A2W22_05150 [Candidatus Levybacteria bacterium RBG_16_35_11]